MPQNCVRQLRPCTSSTRSFILRYASSSFCVGSGVCVGGRVVTGVMGGWGGHRIGLCAALQGSGRPPRLAPPRLRASAARRCQQPPAPPSPSQPLPAPPSPSQPLPAPPPHLLKVRQGGLKHAPLEAVRRDLGGGAGRVSAGRAAKPRRCCLRQLLRRAGRSTPLLLQHAAAATAATASPHRLARPRPPCLHARRPPAARAPPARARAPWCPACG
jgi:hypothetical protein